MTPCHIFWIIFTLDLVISYTEKMLVFQWLQIVLPSLVADLFLFRYERDFMTFSTSRYLDNLLDIDYPYFQLMVNQNPPELQLNKANKVRPPF